MRLCKKEQPVHPEEKCHGICQYRLCSRLYVLLLRAIRLNRNNSASLKPPENTLPITSTKLAGCHRDDFHKGFKNGYQFDFKIFFSLNLKMVNAIVKFRVLDNERAYA